MRELEATAGDEACDPLAELETSDREAKAESAKDECSWELSTVAEARESGAAEERDLEPEEPRDDLREEPDALERDADRDALVRDLDPEPDALEAECCSELPDS